MTRRQSLLQKISGKQSYFKSILPCEEIPSQLFYVGNEAVNGVVQMKISSQKGNSVKKSVPEFNYLDKTINEKVVDFAEKCAKIGRSSVYTLHNQSRFYSAPVKYGTVTVGFLIGVSDIKHTNCNSDGDMVAMLKRQSITA